MQLSDQSIVIASHLVLCARAALTRPSSVLPSALCAAFGALLLCWMSDNPFDKAVVLALQRFARAGHDVQPNNRDHIQAYVVARQTSNRPRAEQVLAILRGAKAKVISGVRLTQEFALVPSSNIQGPVPDWLSDFIVTEEELRKNYRVPPESDFSNFIIVDGNGPLNRLGKRIRKIAFEEVAEFSMSSKGLADSDAPGGQPEAPEGGTGRQPPAPASPPISEVPPVKRLAAAAQAPDAEGAVVQASNKRQRVLKMMQSEEAPPEEAEASMLEDLVNKLKKAAKSKHFYSPDPANSSTVAFWSQQVVQALQAEAAASGAGGPSDASGAGPGVAASGASVVSKKSTLVKQHFPGFLLRLLSANRCYLDLKHFIPIFEGLHNIGAETPGSLISLKAFASVTLGSPEVKDAQEYYTGSDLADRLRFYGSVLYRDFLDCRMAALLGSAQSSSAPQHRQACLKALGLLSAGHGSEGSEVSELQTQAAWAISLFSDSSSVASSMRFALESENSARIEFAQSFVVHSKAEAASGADAASGAIDAASGAIDWQVMHCFVGIWEAAGASFSIERLIKAMDELLRHGLRKVVSNPVAGALMDMRNELQQHFGAKDWIDELSKIVCKAKFALEDGCSEVPDSWCLPANEAPNVRLHQIAKALGKVWPHKGPAWAMAVREAAQAAKEAAQAAKLKAAQDASQAAQPKAPAAQAASGEGPKEKEEEAAKETEEEAEPPKEKEEEAATGAVAASGAADFKPTVKDFVVGDIIKLDDSVGKRFHEQEAQVIKVTAKMITVTLTSGKEKLPKTFSKTAAKVIHPSTLRAAGAGADSAGTAPQGGAASGAPGAASGAPVAAPGADAAAQAPEANEEFDEAEYAANLFGGLHFGDVS